MDLHGGNIYRLQREGKEVLDYSSNINPLGVPQKFIDKAIQNFSSLSQYPDIDYIELREKIANYNQVSRENILVGNGATEILFLYIRALRPKKTLLVGPCFAEYARVLKTVESEICLFPLKEEENFILNVEALISEIQKEDYDLVLLCNPNNPTGRFIPLEELKKLVAVIEEKQIQLFIDEAFIEFVEGWKKKTVALLKKLVAVIEEKQIQLFIDEAFIEFVEGWKKKTVALLKSKSVFVLRALTKFFAIPGLRLGYGMTWNADLFSRMQEEKEPWSVNVFANLAGLTMLEDEEYIRKTEDWIREEKKYFHQELSKISEIKVYETETNFILLQLLSKEAREFQAAMIEKGILVRDASNFPFLNEYYIRLAIKDRVSNQKVIKAIQEILKKGERV